LKVSDTSPLIALYETSLLWLLKELYGKIIIPRSVSSELLKKPEGKEIVEKEWMNILGVKGEVAKILTAFLDEGEAEAIALAKERNLPILLDEKKGRGIAKSLDLKVQGTLGILIKAKRSGLIDSVKDCILQFLEKGYYIDQNLVNEVLKIAGESN
jgi:hypothetical protein